MKFHHSKKSWYLSKRAIVIGLHLTVLSAPCNVVLVGDDTTSDCRAIVATPTDKHKTSFAGLYIKHTYITRRQSRTKKMLLSEPVFQTPQCSATYLTNSLERVLVRTRCHLHLAILHRHKVLLI